MYINVSHGFFKTYTNYGTVMESIKTVNARTENVQNEMDYAQQIVSVIRSKGYAV